MTAFPHTAQYFDPTAINDWPRFNGEPLRTYVEALLRPAADAAVASGLLRSHTSFGGVVTWPVTDLLKLKELALRSPYAMYMFRFGWSRLTDPAAAQAEIERYQANAARKGIPTALEINDNGDLTTSFELYLDEYSFPQPVESFVTVDNQSLLPMGSFGYGGFTIIKVGKFWIGAGVSCLNMEEDDTFAAMAAGATGSRMYTLAGRDPVTNAFRNPLDYL